MNEYLANDSGAYLCKKSLHINCSEVGCFPAKPRYSTIQDVCQGVKCKLRFDQS